MAVASESVPLKLCTFSRVMKEKGIGEAVKAVEAVNKKLDKTVYCLDIYGPVDSSQANWFLQLQSNFPEYIRYCGTVPFDKSVEVLKNYYALLFPTYYDGEGVAGTLIDALAAGVPVLASDWRYNKEVVKDGFTGYLIPARDNEILKNKLIDIFENQVQWNEKKINCIHEAEKYLTSNVVKKLVENMI